MFSCWLYCCVSLSVCVCVCVCVHSMAVHLSPGEQLPVLSLSSLPLQEHTTWSDIRSHTHTHTHTHTTFAHVYTHARAHKHTCIYTFCPSICLSVCRHTFVCLSFRTHPHKAHQSQSSAFLLSLCLPACLPIYLSVFQTVTNDGVGWAGGRGFHTCHLASPAEAQ